MLNCANLTMKSATTIFFAVLLCLKHSAGFLSFPPHNVCRSPSHPTGQNYASNSVLFVTTPGQSATLSPPKTTSSPSAAAGGVVGGDSVTIDLPLQFDRDVLENRFQKDGTLSRRWAEFLRQTAPFVQQAAKLWASGRLSRDDPSLATACRKTLTNLGPAFVKLGQILSVREDILGPVWSKELSKLQNSVDAFGGREAVDEALAQDTNLKHRLESFDPDPVAVASIAQVHKGQWRNDDGTTTEVAIKVLRPNVAYQVGVDLCVLLRAGDILSEWAPRILPASRVDWQALLAGLAKGLWEEVDLSGEAQRQIRFAENMKSVPRIVVPNVLAYNRNVMVSEWINGTPLRSIPSMDDRLKDAQALMRDAYCQSMYVDAFFHADGHGGNLLWVEKGNNEAGELCILDCGLMVDIEPSAAEGLLRLSLHLASRDWTRVVEDVIALGFLPEDLSPALKAEARGIARRIIGPYLDVGGGARAASAYSISSLFDDISSATLKLPTALPPDMILLARAVIQLEGLALRAYPDYRLVDDILPVAARIALRSAPSTPTSDLDGNTIANEARASLLYDLLYDDNEEMENGVYRGTGEKLSFSPERLLGLLGTARGDRVSDGSMTIEEIVDELIQADAARDLVAQETLNILDAVVRDTLWRGVDTLKERGSVFPPFLPSPMKSLEGLAPRLSEKEQLTLLRLLEVLKELESADKKEDSSNSLRPQRKFSSIPSLVDESPIFKLATIPGVRKSIQDITVSALFRQDTNARAAVDAVSEKLRDRLETRLVQTGAPSEVASAISSIVLLKPWRSI